MPTSDVTVNGPIYKGNKSAPFHAYETKHDMFPLRVMKLDNCLFLSLTYRIIHAVLLYNETGTIKLNNNKTHKSDLK